MGEQRQERKVSHLQVANRNRALLWSYRILKKLSNKPETWNKSKEKLTVVLGLLLAFLIVEMRKTSSGISLIRLH